MSATYDPQSPISNSIYMTSWTRSISEFQFAPAQSQLYSSNDAEEYFGVRVFRWTSVHTHLPIR